MKHVIYHGQRVASDCSRYEFSASCIAECGFRMNVYVDRYLHVSDWQELHDRLLSMFKTWHADLNENEVVRDVEV